MPRSVVTQPGHAGRVRIGGTGEAHSAGCAICRATVDGAVWIPQLRRRPAAGGPVTIKLPATLALGEAAAGVPEVDAPLAMPPGRHTYQEITYRESGGVGYLEFSFPGAP